MSTVGRAIGKTRSALQGTALASLALVGVILVGGCKSEEKTAAVTPQAVQVLRIESTSESETWSYVGTIRARFESCLLYTSDAADE